MTDVKVWRAAHASAAITSRGSSRRGKVGADLVDGSRCPVVLAGTINGERRELTHSERFRRHTDDICDDCCLSPAPSPATGLTSSTVDIDCFSHFLNLSNNLRVTRNRRLGVRYRVATVKSAKRRIRATAMIVDGSYFLSSDSFFTRKLSHRLNFAAKNIITMGPSVTCQTETGCLYSRVFFR